jgi:diadenylate cyclase
VSDDRRPATGGRVGAGFRTACRVVVHSGEPPRSGKYHLAMAPRRSAELLAALAVVAPGTHLRNGLDRILQAKMGGLVVVGDGPEVLNICSGGFLLDAAFSPQRLSELAKMDGAIILASDASRIARANVHLVPNPNVPTSETGTRHRTAERVARSIDVPVISISEDMAMVAVYAGDQKHTLEPIPRLLTRANQAIQTLERYRNRLDEVTAALSTVEVEDLVTVRDVVTVLQRTEMVRRVAEEIELGIIELGIEGRLVRLQLEELMGGVEDDRRLVIKDYFHEGSDWHVDEALEALADLSTDDLLDLRAVGAALHLPDKQLDLEENLQARGYRLLAKIPRLPEPIVERLVTRFGSLQKIMRATIDDLDDVSGVGETRARAIKEGLSRLAEASILDRYS